MTTYKHNKCVYACACVCVCVLCNKISSIMCMYQRNVATKTHFCAHFNVTGESEKYRCIFLCILTPLYPYAFVSLQRRISSKLHSDCPVTLHVQPQAANMGPRKAEVLGGLRRCFDTGFYWAGTRGVFAPLHFNFSRGWKDRHSMTKWSGCKFRSH